jgi:hypothetical protein
LDLALLDRDDEDERRYLIEAEHPLFAQALRTDAELEVGGEPMSPRLHVSMHEIVTNQLWADDPPEVWATAQRLAALGYERHVILHMIASLVSHDLWEPCIAGRPSTPPPTPGASTPSRRAGRRRTTPPRTNAMGDAALNPRAVKRHFPDAYLSRCQSWGSSRSACQ